MQQGWTGPARDARARAARVLADAIGCNQADQIQDRMDYISTVKRLDAGTIGPRQAVDVFDRIIDRHVGSESRLAGDRPEPGIIVMGQVGRDLVLNIPGIPGADGSVPVRTRREMLGGKGANQAVGLRQLGADVRVIAVIGQDQAGKWMLQELTDSEIDTRFVTRRGETALLVDVVDDSNARRLLEHIPPSSLLTVDDIERAVAADALEDIDTICLQLQQPAAALLAAATQAHSRRIRVILDGAVQGSDRDELLPYAQVVRANSAEAQLLTGMQIGTPQDARKAAAKILEAGPELVVLTVDGLGEFVAWQGDDAFIPFKNVPVVDRTGAGDAFLVGLVSALRSGMDADSASRFASDAAAATIEHLGGRPDLAALRPRLEVRSR